MVAAGTGHGCEQPWYKVTPGAKGNMDMRCPYIITQRGAGQIKLKLLLPLLPSQNS